MRGRVCHRLAAAGALVMSGCASQADLVRTDRQLRALIQENQRQVQTVQRELERLRARVEDRGVRSGGEGEDRVTVLEERLSELEKQSGTTTGEETARATASTLPPTTTTLPAPPPSTVDDDEWRREVSGEQASVSKLNVAEKGEFLGLLDGLARKDCARVTPQLNTFAASRKESPLADNAIYWAARCYALRRDQNQAIAKFYDVVQRYPKGDKAPAALWAQGNIFLELGDAPDARLAFSKLIRDYPNVDEAARARKKLSELER